MNLLHTRSEEETTSFLEAIHPRKKLLPAMLFSMWKMDVGEFFDVEMAAGEVFDVKMAAGEFFDVEMAVGEFYSMTGWSMIPKSVLYRGSQISSENRHSNLISTSQSKINPFKISVHSKKSITF